MTNTILVIIFSLLMLPGIVGVLVPVLPGVPFMFVVALIYGFIDKFQHLTSSNILILGTLTLISLGIDYFSGILGAKYGGASGKALTYGMVGLVLGLIVFPPLGSIFGLFIGVLYAELMQHKDQKRAIKAAAGSVIGAITGIALNTILAILFLALFILFALK